MTTRAWALFAAVSVLWGIPYLFIKLAVEELSPAFVAWGRVVLAAVVLLPIAWRLGALAGIRARLAWLAAFATAEVVVPFPLISFGEQHVSSSLTAILIAALPLIVALIALRFDHQERATGVRLAGLLTGLAGVVALLG
ncbi:MAG TPA: EamA family transporter, partial [Thermoleophilaceae bacterium]